MNFFAHQALARRQSRRLVVLFALAVAMMVLAINFIALLAIEWGSGDPVGAPSALFRYPWVFVCISLVTLTIIGVASWIKVGQLRGGGAAVAASLGAQLVPSATQDPHLRRLRNVVEETAIASGVPVPALYVLEQEEGINAFAAGYAPTDAAIAVTRGALLRLNRDELQGVIAHEFSHVLNGDMRLNMRLMGLLFGILVIGLGARQVLLRTRGNGRQAGLLMIVALFIMIVGYVGLFMGRIIKAAISRQREYLADASAVQFTRQSHGLAGALKKIAALPQGSKLVSRGTEEVAHMLFGDGMGYGALFATHPPLVTRIQRLDRSFDPRQIKDWPVTAAMPLPEGADSGLAVGMAAAAPGAPLAAAAEQLVEQVGQPSAAHYQQAQETAAALGEALKESARDAASAPFLVIALGLRGEEAQRDEQLHAVARRLGEQAAAAAQDSYARIHSLPPTQRLPLVSLAFPALRRRARPFLTDFMQLLEEIGSVGGAQSLSGYCLSRLVRSQLAATLRPAQHAAFGTRRIHECKPHVQALLAVFAAHGHGDHGQAQQAYRAGMDAIQPGDTDPFAPPADWVAALDAAWPCLDRLNPAGKQLLVEGMVKALAHDGQMQVAEAELLRTACALLRCPLPPLLSSATGTR